MKIHLSWTAFSVSILTSAQSGHQKYLSMHRTVSGQKLKIETRYKYRGLHDIHNGSGWERGTGEIWGICRNLFVNDRSALVGSVGTPAKKIINNIIQANQ